MIETKRLTLRPFNRDDLDIIAKLYSDEEIMAYMPIPVLDNETAQKLLNRFVAGWKDVPQINYEMAVVCKQTNEKIGRAEITRHYSEESAMIGWMLIKSAWGKGLATEAAKAVIRCAFDVWNLELLSIYRYPENVRSGRVIEKCGFTYEGTLKRAFVQYDGTVRDHVCSSMTREEYYEKYGY